MSISQAVISCDPFQRLVPLVLSGTSRSARNFTVESHDRAEGITLRYKSELAWCLLVILAESLHLLLLDRDESLTEKVSHGHAHYLVPHTFSIVEDARILLLFLCAIEETAL